MDFLVMSVINSIDDERGMSKEELIRRLIEKMEMSISELLESGYIYSTVDDNHWKVTPYPDDGLDAHHNNTADNVNTNHVAETSEDETENR